MKDEYWNYILIALIVLILVCIFTGDTKTEEGFGAPAEVCNKHAGIYMGYSVIGEVAGFDTTGILNNGKKIYNEHGCDVHATWEQQAGRFRQFTREKGKSFFDIGGHTDPKNVEKYGVPKASNVIGPAYADYVGNSDSAIPVDESIVSSDSSSCACATQDELDLLKSQMDSLTSSVDSLSQQMTLSEEAISEIQSSAEELQLAGSEMAAFESSIEEALAQMGSGNGPSNTWQPGWFATVHNSSNFGGNYVLGPKQNTVYGVKEFVRPQNVMTGLKKVDDTVVNIPHQNVGLRLLGVFTAQTAAEYSFRVNSDDGIRLMYNRIGDDVMANPNALYKKWTPMKLTQGDSYNADNAVSAWKGQADTVYTSEPFDLAEGEKILVRVDWFQGPGNSTLDIKYQTSIQNGQFKSSWMSVTGNGDANRVSHSTLWNDVPLLGYH